MIIKENNLPNDVNFLKELLRGSISANEALQEENKALKHQLSLLRRSKYGPRTERFDEDQQRLSLYEDDPPPNEEQEDEGSREKKSKDAQKRRKKPKQSSRNPREHNLPEQEIEIPVDEEKCNCPNCKSTLVKIGEEVTRQLEYTPAQFFVKRYVRDKLACKNCHETIVTADVPYQPIQKGMPGPGMLAHILTSKYADHLPLQRLKGIFKRSGLHLNANTMCDWIKSASTLLQSLFMVMLANILESQIVSTDSTGIVVRNGNKKGRVKGNIWAYLGDEDHPHVIFDYTASLSRDGPINFLKKYSGYVQADAHSVYDELFRENPVFEVGCMAHARRKFKQSLETERELAAYALETFQELYKIESESRKEGDSRDERLKRRKEEAVPILESFKKWLLKSQLKVLPKSPMGKAIAYTLKNWKALNRYTKNGIISIDNNHAERALRSIVIGRKNYMFAGSEAGAKSAVVIYSFVESCKRNDIDPFEYFRDIFIRMNTHPSNEIEKLLPSNWKKLIEEQGLATLPEDEIDLPELDNSSPS